MPDSKHKPFKPVWFLFAILLGLTAISVISRLTAADEKVPWRTDLAAATDESKRDGKPLLLYFTASWCGPCQQMKRETWNRDDVADRLTSYVPVKIDIDQNAALAEQYRIESVPTLLLLDGEGKVARSSFYRLSGEEFLKWISAS